MPLHQIAVENFRDFQMTCIGEHSGDTILREFQGQAYLDSRSFDWSASPLRPGFWQRRTRPRCCSNRTKNSSSPRGDQFHALAKTSPFVFVHRAGKQPTPAARGIPGTGNSGDTISLNSRTFDRSGCLYGRVFGGVGRGRGAAPTEPGIRRLPTRDRFAHAGESVPIRLRPPRCKATDASRRRLPCAGQRGAAFRGATTRS